MESVVKHTPKTYYLELRQDYVALCLSLTYQKSEKSKSSPYCKALILAIMEKWTNEKIHKKKDPYIYMTYAQWTEEMYGMFGRWVILDSLDELTQEGLIIREKCRINGRESYKYLLNVQDLNKRLAELSSLQVDATDGNIDATSLQVDATDLGIDGTSSSPASKSRHFIESTQIQTIESEKERPPSRTSQLTSEQLRIDALYCALSDVTQPPIITDQLKKYWDKLAQYIATQEDMISLYDHTKRDCATKKNKRVYPGNLADCVIAWHQEEEEKRTPVPWSQPDTSQPDPTEEPGTDVPMYAGQPLFYWTEETMEAANFTKTRRNSIRTLQAEAQMLTTAS